jgi:hypothetical protein
MAYDDATGQLVLFGGQNYSKTFDDTWTWDGSTWTEQHPVDHPSRRSYAGMAYDDAAGQLFLYGGLKNSGYLEPDSWVWDGSNWDRLDPPISPIGRCCFGMAYDAGSGLIVTFGIGRATWVWDGATWIPIHPAGSPGPTRWFTGLAPFGDHLVLFGGGSCADWCFYDRDTWTWDGTTWIEQRPASRPSSRRAVGIAYDPIRDQTVLFGGDAYNSVYGDAGYFDDTWAWNGTTWTRLSPSTVPHGREGPAMAWDPAVGAIVMFGGEYSSETGSGHLNDTWTWDGSDWTQH